MRQLRKPNGPRDIPAPKMLEHWKTGDIVMREVPGENRPYFRIVGSVQGAAWTKNPDVILTTPPTGVLWNGMIWGSNNQARVLKYTMEEAQERYRLCPEADVEEPF